VKEPKFEKLVDFKKLINFQDHLTFILTILLKFIIRKKRIKLPSIAVALNDSPA